jgi:MFS family permease
MNTDIFTLWLPIVIAAIVTASFAAPLSLLTLLIAVGRGQRERESRLNKFGFGLTFGVALFLAIIFFLLLVLFETIDTPERTLWLILATYSFLVGLFITLFYYRRGKQGTSLWLPRRLSKWFYTKVQTDKTVRKTIGLGIIAVLSELFLSLAPMSIAANFLVTTSSSIKDFGATIFVAIAILPLLVLIFMTAGGEKLTKIQRWREKNKRFSQVMVGIMLLTLSLYILSAKVFGQ